MTEILTLARKDLKLLLRDRAGFFFTFFWPVIMAMFFGSIFGGGSADRRAIELLVVDRDGSASSQRLVAELGSFEEVQVEEVEQATAEDAVRRGDAAAWLLVPEGFGESSRDRFVSGAPRVSLHTDPSRFAEAGMLEGLLLRAGAVLLQESLTEPDQVGRMVEENLGVLGAGPDFEGRSEIEGFLRSLQELVGSEVTGQGAGGMGEGALTPLTVERQSVEVQRRGPSNPYAISFAQGMLWAMLACAASFGISLAVERGTGTLVRLRCSALRGMDILAGKALACFLTALAMSSFLISLAVVAFGVRPLSWPLLVLAVVCTGLCFVGIMMLLSVLGRTEMAASGIGWAILLVLAMFGGGMVPLFIMPSWMISLSDFSPVKWGILAIEGAVWRGFSLQEMMLPCGILLTVGLVTFAIGAKLFQWGELG